MMTYYLGIFVTVAIGKVLFSLFLSLYYFIFVTALCSISSEEYDPDKTILSFIRNRCVANSDKGLNDYTTIQVYLK